MLYECLERSWKRVGVTREWESEGGRLSCKKLNLWLPLVSSGRLNNNSLTYFDSFVKLKFAAGNNNPRYCVNSWAVSVRSGIRVNELFQNRSNSLNQFDVLSVLNEVQRNWVILQVLVRVCFFKMLTLSSKWCINNAQRWKNNLVLENSIPHKKTYHLPLFQPF